MRWSEMDTFVIILCVALFIMIVLSAFFSMSETAFTSVSVFRLKDMAESGDKKAQRALDVISDYDQFISVTLLSNNAVNITGTTVSTLIFTAIVGVETGDFVATIFMLVVILIFGELLPKSYAKKNSIKVCLATAKVYQALEAIVWPISWWLQELAARFDRSNHSEELVVVDELNDYIDDAEKSGSIEPNQANLLRAVLVFDKKNVADICTPRDKIVSIRADEPVENFLDIVAKTRFSRIIVIDKDIDHPIGIAYVKDYITLSKEFEVFSIRNLVRPLLTLPETAMAFEAFDNFRQRKVSIAIIRSKDEKTVGLITMEDVLESLVGDIDDEQYIKEAIGIVS